MSKVNLMESNNSLDINRISSGTTVVGTIETGSDLRIDGNVDGSVTSGGRVIVGDTAFIKGDLVAKTLDVMGKFEGNIIVSDTTTLKNTATITGSLNPGKLIVESGAKFNGTCVMGKAATQTALDAQKELETEHTPKKVVGIKKQQAAS